MKRTTAKDVISEMDVVFARVEYPKKMLSDNGPPFNSQEFRAYCKSCGIELIHSIPYQPRITGEVEAQNC